jgi:hypothetical protein
MMEEKTYEYKGNIITEAQIDFLIKDRKHLLNEFTKEVRENIKLKKKLKFYERIIGFLFAGCIMLIILYFA